MKKIFKKILDIILLPFTIIAVIFAGIVIISNFLFTPKLFQKFSQLTPVIFSKKLFIILLFILIILIVGIFIWQYFGEPEKEEAEDETANWQTYRNEEFGFEVEYPSDVIDFSKDNRGIVMAHYVPIEQGYLNPCDFKGVTQPLTKLNDFYISMENINQGFAEAVKSNEGNYLVSNFLLDNKLKMSEGFIDEANIGSLEGYRVTSGAEGCGQYRYYFPLDHQYTLFVTRFFITELKPIFSDYEKYLNLPGVIKPDEEEKLFNQILSTFRFLE